MWLGCSGLAYLPEPEGLVALVELGRGASDLFGVDEDSVGFERGVDFFEDGALVGVVEMVDGERGDDGAEFFGERLFDVVGALVGDARIIAEAVAGEGEHGRGEVDQMDVGVGKAIADESGEQAGAGAEVEDGFCACGDEVDGPAIEGVAARDEAGTVAVVGGGRGVEDFFGAVDHLFLL